MSKMSFSVAWRCMFALLCIGCFGVGCRTEQPASASFASVIITNKTTAEIEQTTAAVFGEAGYQMVTGPKGTVFEREGTRGNQIAHGGILATEPVEERVRLQIVPLTKGAQRLQCNAYMVRRPGDPFFEDEVKLANWRGGPYQKLLDEVASRLK